MAYISFQPSDYFNAKLWNGNSSTQAITGIGFQPDFVWLKQRTGTQNHQLLDAIRGANNCLFSNLTNAAVQDTDILNSFDSDGYTLGYQDQSNDTGATYVGWNWRANGSGSSNTDGTITSTVSANTTAGFSIVKWTGTASAGTIGHGLGVAPKVVLVKRYSTSGGGWLMQHGDLTGATYVVKLNTSGVEENDGANFNSAFPTSSVFSVYNSNNTNKSGDLHIAYCFAEKKGFSKFGKYNGLGTTTGQFVYTGFKPAFVMTKIATTGGSDTGGWVIMDNKSYPNNLSNSPVLFANGNYAQSDSYNGEMFSNGFRFNANSVTVNGSGNSYIYMAFAEHPLVSSNGVTATAR